MIKLEMISLAKKPEQERNGYKDPARLKAIRDLPCIVCEMLDVTQQSRTEAHHFMGLGLGLKASDLFTFSLCNRHHTGSYTKPERGVAIHSGLKAFEANFGTQEELLEITNNKLN